MACIGCGLGLNADGTGRVDVDTEGGLECTGTAGGATNTAGRGLAIKADPADGNSVQVGSNGLYVPPVFRLDTEGANHYGTNLTGPGGGSSISSPEISITLTNNSALRHVYLWNAALEWGTNDADPGLWIELATQVGGGNWTTPAAITLPAGAVSMPMVTRTFRLGLNAGESTTIRSKFRLYTGFLFEYNIFLTAWGGPEEGQ